MSLTEYFKNIGEKTNELYDVAKEARTKGLDPKSIVEISIATNLAQRAIALVGTMYPQVNSEKVEQRIRELEKEYGFLDHAVCLKIAEEISKEKFCKFQNLEQAMDAGIRVAIAYITLGVVASPLEGYTHFKLKKTHDGKDYISAYFSGPIRSAGTTSSSVALIVIDHLREIFGYAKYDPTEVEVKRAVTEVYDYHERITNLQYLGSEEEITFLAKNLPIQIDGDPSEEREVSNYKDLERIETNRLRNGMCLVLSEGLAQKAAKALKIVNKLRARGFKLSDWDFLDEFVKFQKNLIEQKKQKATGTYIQDAVAGRPIFGHPSYSGAFRLRYGRSRFSGYSAVALNPATMKILNGFIAVATQLKLEKPMKAAAIGVSDDIEGPIVKLQDGAVVKVNSLEEAEKINDKVKEVLYNGDILIAYGDFFDRNHVLLPCGYNEEWWFTELKEIATKYSDPEILKDKSQQELEKIQKALQYLDKEEPKIEDAMVISELFGIPMYPRYIFYWSQINFNQFRALQKWLCEATIINGKLNLPYESHRSQELNEAKRALELLGVEHIVATANVVIENDIARALAVNLGLDVDLKDFNKTCEAIDVIQSPDNDVLKLVNQISKFKIKDKAGSFIGARMGRPEKAKPRELTGSPHVIFPVGEEGGRLRSIQSAVEKGYIQGDFPIYLCENCKRETIYFICEICGNKTRQLYYCNECSRKITTENCPLHGKAKDYAEQKINIKEHLDTVAKYINVKNIPVLIKGVRGTSSTKHIPEHLAKGILRAAHNIHVNKDGTIRYDASELPITQFKAKEVNVSIEKLKELGYTKDINGKELKTDEQILELMPHDIILPCSDTCSDEPADKTFFNVARFVDDLLVNFYKMQAFYNLEKKEDLVGHLTLCMAPHNCAGVVGRIIGFSKTQAFLASPYMHAAMRRDCDGDEAAIMLLLDALINFSREYLPAHRGGRQDAPLILNARIRQAEVDDMIFNMDVVKNYPLELYMAAEKEMPPNSVKIEQISDRIKTGDEFAGLKNLYYTHETKNINESVLCSSYKSLLLMKDKLLKQMDLADKLRAVDASDMAQLVIGRHFIRDIKGNLNKFTQQQFRCVQCNEKYRRPPLAGKCLKCGGRIIFTISEGFILKYLEPAIQLANTYNVSSYIKQTLEIVKQAIETIFGKETEKQQALKKWL